MRAVRLMNSPSRPSAASIAPVLFDALCALGEGLFVTQGTRIVFADAGCERISGYSARELLALPSIVDLVAPAERPAVAARLATRLRGEALDPHYVSALVHRDGHIVPVEIAVHLCDAARGELLAIVRDISMRVTLEHERDHLHARTVAAYEDLFERAPVAYHELDLDGRITRVNDTELALFGYKRGEMLGRHVWEFSAEPESVERAVRQRIAGEVPPARQRSFRRKDGQVFWGWVTVREIRDEAGTLAGLRAAIVETTQLRQAREALQTSEHRYRQLFEQIPVGIYETTPAGRFVAVNPAFVKMLGYDSEEEMLAVPDVRVLYARPEVRDRFQATLERSGFITEFENVVYTRDGDELYVLESAYAVRDQTGAIGAYQGTVTDLTERRRLEDQLRQAQKMEAIGRFAGGVAHDFNNLLTVIAGYAEMIAEALPAGDQSSADMQEIITATARAASMTRQLLAFSRKQVLQLRMLDLNAVVHSVSPMLQRLIGEDVRLLVHLGAEPLLFQADEIQLQQVILNLATNARDAMPAGGALALRTEATNVIPDLHSGEVPLPEGGGWAKLSVTDTGCGMDAATRALIFEPFFTTKPPGQGTGLGLATSYGIVKQLQGYILVDSEPGRGTTFSLYFPLRMGVAGATDVTPAVFAHRARQPGAHILVVEDESAVRELAAAVLRRAGYDVTTAASPAEALRVADETLASVDLILSDVIMPGMRGPELVRLLRERRSDIPALFMTGYVDPATESAATVGPFLLKPFQPSRLLERVAQELDIASGRPE
jgi:two-component system cell cycle sensor histidine kinase/response regulator CckA